MEDLNLDSLEINGKFRGRAKTIRSQSVNGRYIKAAPVEEAERSYDLAADATIRSALLRQAAGGGALKDFSISAADLHKKIYQRQIRSLIVSVTLESDSFMPLITILLCAMPLVRGANWASVPSLMCSVH